MADTKVDSGKAVNGKAGDKKPHQGKGKFGGSRFPSGKPFMGGGGYGPGFSGFGCGFGMNSPMQYQYPGPFMNQGNMFMQRHPQHNAMAFYGQQNSNAAFGHPLHNRPFFPQQQHSGRSMHLEDAKYHCQFCTYRCNKQDDMTKHYTEKHSSVVEKAASLDNCSSIVPVDNSRASKGTGPLTKHSLIFSPSNYIFISNPGEYLLDINNEQLEGILCYIPHFLNKEDADTYFHAFKKDLPWKQVESHSKKLDKDVKEPRLSCYYGEDYEYGPVKWQDKQKFDPKVEELKQLVEKQRGLSFNSALGILYRTGRDHIGWHSDDEPELGPAPTIASVSFGATRYFEFTRVGMTSKLVRLALKHGDLLITSGCIQQKWKHWVPRDPDVQHCRINITFRHIDPSLRKAAEANKTERKAASASSGKSEKSSK